MEDGERERHGNNGSKSGMGMELPGISVIGHHYESSRIVIYEHCHFDCADADESIPA